MINKYDIDENNTKFKLKNYKKLLLYLKPHKKLIFFIMLYGSISTIAILFSTKLFQYAIDNVLISKNWTVFIKIIILLMLTTLVNIFFNNIRGKKMDILDLDIQNKLRYDLFKHLQYLSTDYYDTRPHGKILIRVTEYTKNVSSMITDRLFLIILNLYSLIFVTIFMLFTSVKLSLIVLAGALLEIIIFSITAKKKRSIRLTLNNKSSNSVAYLAETLKGIQTTQSFNRENINTQIYDNLNLDYVNTYKSYLVYGNLGWFSVQNIDTIVNAALYFCGLFFLYPSVSIGIIFAMVTYAGRFWNPIKLIFSQMDEFINSMTYLERIFELLDEPIKIKDNKSLVKKLTGKITFNKVAFSYIENVKVLNNISFEIKSGEKIAVVGATGSGKSTIANLIARFYDIDNGEILLDDINIKDLKISCLRDNVVIMQQDNFLFSKPLIDNLKYGDDSINDEDVINLCKELGIHSFIMQLPNQYKTILEHNGKKLSDGQIQLLSYVRALITKPKILILDEATSKIDTKTETIIQKKVAKKLKNITTITIAHRLSTITGSDRIFLIDDHHIAEAGTHNELLSLKGKYYHLYNSQQALLK